MADTAETMVALRALHRPGTGDMATALAFTRAALAEDWEALLALARGLDDDDDLLGVTVWLSLIGAGGLRGNPDAEAYLAMLAEAEREHA